MATSAILSALPHRVLFIPELLDLIFNFLNRNANVVNACVCKDWSEVALDVIWKEVNNLLRLFRLLKPICPHEEKFEYCFETLPEASDWSRFEKYASRVRLLKFQPSMYDLEISPLLDDVARTRTSLEILPNMHTLEWMYTSTAHMERCKLFLHRRLRHLSVAAPSQRHPRPDFYTDLCARAPHLHTLMLFVGSPGDPIDTELGVLLRNLPELKKIVLPEFHYTSKVIEELSRAKSISVVDFSQDLSLGCGNPTNVISFCPVLEKGAFPCLRELNLSLRIDDLDRFFRSSFAPIHITTLFANAYTDHTPTEIHALLTCLSQQCRVLTHLNIQLYHKVMSPQLPVELQMSYNTIKPVLSIPTLTCFELVHKYPLRITLEEIEDLASKLPNIETLMLNAEPLFIDEEASTLDLRALLPFAAHCPRLRILGLYINASETEIPSSHVSLEPFYSLKTFSIGTSQVRDTSAVAKFLSRIFPVGCRLELGLTWTEFGSGDDRHLPPELRIPLQRRCVGWQNIARLLPSLVELRQEEMERSRALHEEVEDLRVRNQLLMDKAGATQTKDSCVVA